MLKALADDSRYALFSELGRGEAPLSTMELAGRLGLHPNTVRLHLERLRAAGLVRSATDSRGGVGRPQLLWSVVPDAPSFGFEPDGFRVLAHLLADALAASAPSPAALRAVGRRAGEARVGGPGGRRPRRRRRGRSSGGPPRGSRTGGGTVAPRGPVPERTTPGVVAAEPVAAGLLTGGALDEVVAELADLGFDPLVEPDGAPGAAGGGGLTGPAGAAGVSGASVVFTSCPFRELATSYPDLVCALHRGVTEGIVAAVAGRRPGVSASVVGFSTLVDADPCRAEVALRAQGRPGVPAGTAPGAS